jgi:hypothetical protein
MTDPLDTAEAILDQHPTAWFGDWTIEDLKANAHALEMILGEMKGARTRARVERINALAERAAKPSSR